MHAAARKIRHLHPLKAARRNSHSARRLPVLKRTLEKVYAGSVKKIKKNPYQSTGVLLGLGLLSGLYVWYRFLNK